MSLIDYPFNWKQDWSSNFDIGHRTTQKDVYNYNENYICCKFTVILKMFLENKTQTNLIISYVYEKKLRKLTFVSQSKMVVTPF
jgi:hypothetical protein